MTIKSVIVPAKLCVLASLLAFTEASFAADDPPSGVIAFASFAPRHWDLHVADLDGTTFQLTHSQASDYNGAFSPDGKRIVFASERDGNVDLYIKSAEGDDIVRLTHGREMDEHPAWSPDGRRIAFVSTRDEVPAGRSWTAIHVMDADGSNRKRISGTNTAAYAPAWSPDGKLIAFAAGSDRPNEIHMMNADGSGQRLVATGGSWPTFIEAGTALAFHRQGEGARWDIWKVSLEDGEQKVLIGNASMPRANIDGSRLAYVDRSGDKKQIAVLDLESGESKTITSAPTDHWNPNISPDGRRVVFHRTTAGLAVPNIERWRSPDDEHLTLARLDGSFPAFSPDGSRIAFIGRNNFSTVEAMRFDGSDRKTLFTGSHRSLFATAWANDPDQIVFSHGGVFAPSGFEVNIKAVAPDGGEPATLPFSGTSNDGFASFSPDGRRVVFRSGRDGLKNLYIANRATGEVIRLTNGEWTDTMCEWSGDGEWIAFSSDRDDNYEIWMIRPDGSGLKKLIGGGGRNTHPYFSPDSQWVVFTSQRAGWSADPISLPGQPQPYGDLFMIRIDGTDLTRLTHNGSEEGTPAWGLHPAKAATR